MALFKLTIKWSSRMHRWYKGTCPLSCTYMFSDNRITEMPARKKECVFMGLNEKLFSSEISLLYA